MIWILFHRHQPESNTMHSTQHQHKQTSQPQVVQVQGAGCKHQQGSSISRIGHQHKQNAREVPKTSSNQAPNAAMTCQHTQHAGHLACGSVDVILSSGVFHGRQSLLPPRSLPLKSQGGGVRWKAAWCESS